MFFSLLLLEQDITKTRQVNTPSSNLKFEFDGNDGKKYKLKAILQLQFFPKESK